ncbi:hypothetical protein DPEC_G00056640 [Dallia pectoralis]|uniref:Uncharacterized protein n=1 Tax=Dallia pectoralis TaxID=75939 RepID=A0ACC2H5M1_DALPE|nr:hypothetical protein DPEC_G00056640 [Dallia pectoralis]
MLSSYRSYNDKLTRANSAPNVYTDVRINSKVGAFVCDRVRVCFLFYIFTSSLCSLVPLLYLRGGHPVMKELPLQSVSSSAVTTICPSNLPTSLSDSLVYTSVNFHKNPTFPNEAAVAITEVGTSPVTIGQTRPTLLPIVHADPAPTIYSTVGLPKRN